MEKNMTYKISTIKKRRTFKYRLFSLLILLFATIILTNCKKDDSSSGSNDCQSRTGNSMGAEIDGNPVCTDLGTAILTTDNGSSLSVVGFLSNADPAASITLDIDNPGIGTFDLTDGQYSTDDESAYYVVDKESSEGSGSVTITELDDSHVAGTFEFTAIGIDASTDNPTGDQVKVTNGTFYFVLDSSYL